ncbi:MAG: hypothetical protein ACQZ3M_09530 [cyanobacterium endosymbiont of Rhopalodia fuxianensis]
MPSIDLATQTDLLDIHQLIKQIFYEEKSTQITVQGCDNFLGFIACSSLRKRLGGDYKTELYKISTELIVIIKINKNNHILLFFVKKLSMAKKYEDTIVIMLKVMS